jgi:hypothetical protein
MAGGCVRKAVLFLLAVPLLATAPTWEVGNALAMEYDHWCAMRNVRVQDSAQVGTVSASEFLQWQKVKSAWRRLERQVDAEYRGEVR